MSVDSCISMNVISAANGRGTTLLKAKLKMKMLRGRRCMNAAPVLKCQPKACCEPTNTDARSD